MIEVAFGCWVAVAMPLRAWRRRLRAAPVRFDRYLVETLLLIGVLGWILWRREVPPASLGLVVSSWGELVLELGICLLVVAGPDAWFAWRIATAPRPDTLPDPDPIFTDVLAGRQATRTFIAVALVGSVWEELCFRATALLLVPQTPAGLLAGIGAGSLVFGAQHLRSGVRRAAYACGYGVMFSILYVATGNLVAVIVAHAAGNILSGLQWTPQLERLRRQAAPSSSIFIG